MVIKYAILGFLSWRPLAGYDLKKLFVDAGFIYWSGNNNQIYRTLVELHQEGLVADEVIVQERGPARKVYTITAAGLAQLHAWLLTAPEAPQHKNAFLIQLAWADALQAEDLDVLLARYAHEVEVQLLTAREEKRRGRINPARTGREALLWAAIHDNRIGFYERELAWVTKLRGDLAAGEGMQETAD